MGSKIKNSTQLKTFQPEIVRKKSQVWYLENINIMYSFETLENLAVRLGADVNAGDILVVDNGNKNRRKIFKKTRNGAIQIYLKTARNNKFFPLLNSGKGKVGNLDTPIAQCFYEALAVN